MEWHAEAEKMLDKVPFFVKKRVRKKVEEEAERAGHRRVTCQDVQRARKRYLARMEEEVLESVRRALACYKEHAEGGERFSDCYGRLGREAFTTR